MELLTSLNQTLIDAMGPLGPLIAVGGLGLLLVLLTLPSMLKKRVDPLDKLPVPARLNLSRKTQSRALRRGDKVDKLQKFATFLEPQDEKQMSTARLKMMRAGYRSKNAVRAFHASQFASGHRASADRRDPCHGQVEPGRARRPDACDDDDRAGCRRILPAAILGLSVGFRQRRGTSPLAFRMRLT